VQTYLEDWEKLLDDPPFEDVPDLLDMLNMVDKVGYTLATDLADFIGFYTLRVSRKIPILSSTLQISSDTECVMIGESSRPKKLSSTSILIVCNVMSSRQIGTRGGRVNHALNQKREWPEE
jgi:hypothetical protein